METLKLAVVGHGGSTLVDRLRAQPRSGRQYALVGASGNRQLLEDMAGGAASADAALLVVDAAEGAQERARGHAVLLRLLGIPRIVVAVDGMDLAGYAEARFRAVRAALAAVLEDVGVTEGPVFVPVAAREGANLEARSDAMPWHEGPSLLEALDALPPPQPPEGLPLRLWVHDVHERNERRVVVGRVQSGTLRAGDTLLFSPSGATARVARLEAPGAPAPAEARAGQRVGLVLEEEVFVERGQLASHAERPPALANAFRASLFWRGRRPLAAGAQLRLRHGCAETPAVVERLERVIDPDSLAAVPGDAAAGTVAEALLRVRGLLALDAASHLPATGRFALVDGGEIAGVGAVSAEGLADQRRSGSPKSANLFHVEHRVSAADRARMNGHRGGILWFTGLSGSGKTTLAVELERLLFRKGCQAFLLDGDNVRRGLNADLGFSPRERSENIRRVGEVAALMAEAGMIVVSAFISPYRVDRDRVRAAHPELFHEVYINAPLEVCEARDVKGLYRRAREGKIPEFTGISAPYEPPVAPELEVRTGEWPLARCVAELALYVQRRFGVDAGVRARAPARRAAEG